MPATWPPRLTSFPTSVEKDPTAPPYLTSPPEVIPIDVGRQLFVDDFLIAETTLKRTFHLQNGKLYAFWVSPDASGASRGYVAAGGPGFTGPTDTVGR